MIITDRMRGDARYELQKGKSVSSTVSSIMRDYYLWEGRVTQAFIASKKDVTGMVEGEKEQLVLRRALRGGRTVESTEWRRAK